MKTAIVTLALVALALNVNSAPVDNVVSSAFMFGDSVIYNLDFVDPFGLPVFDVKVNSRIGNTEYTTTVDHIGTPYYLNTYEGTQSYSNPSGMIEFYGRVEADTLLLTQSYKNDGNQFPPDPVLYADLADDPAGDTLPGTLGQWLDITGSAITYSDDRIFARLNNAGGGWPTSQGLNFFAYGFILYNPGGSDLSALALVYVNVPFFYTPGLYSVNLVDTSFTRIADIQYQTSGDNLHMSCAVSDLLLDPNWNQWPPESEFVLTGGITISVVSLQPNLNDYTYPSAFIPITQYLDTDQNTAPVLDSHTANPIPFVSVEVNIDYQDADNNLAVFRLVIFDGISYEMGTADHNYIEGSTFDALIPWPGPGWHHYYFNFMDGNDGIITPPDSIYLSPNGIDETPVPLSFELKQNYPNPFNAKTIIEFQLSEPADVKLTVYDIAGRKVADLAGDNYSAGAHSIIWDGTNNHGHNLSSGLYLYKMKAGEFIATRKMLLIK